jgi:HlyD family secretion protein
LPKPLIAIALAAIILVAWLLFRDDAGPDDSRFTGYVVSDNLYLSSPIAGTIAWIGVKEGQQILPGTPLFRVDPTGLAAQAEEARAGVNATSAEVAEQRASLARARANLAVAEAEADRLASEFARLSGAQREKPGSVAGLDLDQARTAYRAAQRRRDAARTELAAASAAIGAAEARVAQRRAGVTQAEAELAELSPAAPTKGRVEDVMYQQGEWAPANAPVVSIVPLDKVKVRFYVPQSVVSAYRPGTRIVISCDGCRSGMTASVSFIATRPEYTPPVIYSLDAREKLSFMVEALPSHPQLLVPGQPIDVTPLSEGGKR